MKMVDGSTVRHGREDCSDPEKQVSAEGGVTNTQGEGKEEDNKEKAGGGDTRQCVIVVR